MFTWWAAKFSGDPSPAIHQFCKPSQEKKEMNVITRKTPFSGNWCIQSSAFHIPLHVYFFWWTLDDPILYLGICDGSSGVLWSASRRKSGKYAGGTRFLSTRGCPDWLQRLSGVPSFCTINQNNKFSHMEIVIHKEKIIRKSCKKLKLGTCTVQCLPYYGKYWNRQFSL